jgi:uncharacterized protein
MPENDQHSKHPGEPISHKQEQRHGQSGEEKHPEEHRRGQSTYPVSGSDANQASSDEKGWSGEEDEGSHPEAPGRRSGARGTAAMDPKTRQEVARKGGLAVSTNRQHMAEIGRKGGQSVSKNREHMAKIGRKGGAASRGHR